MRSFKMLAIAVTTALGILGCGGADPNEPAPAPAPEPTTAPDPARTPNVTTAGDVHPEQKYVCYCRHLSTGDAYMQCGPLEFPVPQC